MWMLLWLLLWLLLLFEGRLCRKEAIGAIVVNRLKVPM